MLHGKKGFERIVWAFKNVLNHSLAWLFHDLNSPRDIKGLLLPMPTPTRGFLSDM